MQTFANLKEAEAALEPFFPSRLKRFAYTTEHIQEFMRHIDDPQDKPKAIHVAGTSGKTSTAYYAASLLKQAGKKVGLLVSPHAETINERVQINLEPLPEKEFCSEFAIFLGMVQKSGITLTSAEIMYAFAYWEFVRHQVEYIVVETGMGGLLDATNVITREDKICVIADVGLDHTNVLGSTLQEITGHKAGIIHPHNTVFCHMQGNEVIDEIREACRRNQADLHILGKSAQPEQIDAPLPLIQKRNFSLALAAVQFALARNDETLTNEHINVAARIQIPGRLEMFTLGNKTLVLDGAHNPQKLFALRQSIEAYFPGKPVAALFGLVGGRGRILEELIAELAPFVGRAIVTSLPPSRSAHAGRDPEEVAAACKAAGLQSVIAIADREKALQTLLARPEPVLLITGSFYLIESLRPIIRRSM
jgi:dihydrofolate synthase/folylpolyglutamate synthase